MLHTSAEPVPKNCEPCGANMIPYPLSTNQTCGDPMYFSFYCNTSSGHVGFKTPSGNYCVTSINPSTRKFSIQSLASRNSRQNLQLLNQSLPFFVSNDDSGNSSFEVEDEVEISWMPPREPFCSSLADCKDWPQSTCNQTRDGKRCLCNRNYQWDGSNLNCTKG